MQSYPPRNIHSHVTKSVHAKPQIHILSWRIRKELGVRVQAFNSSAHAGLVYVMNSTSTQWVSKKG